MKGTKGWPTILNDGGEFNVLENKITFNGQHEFKLLNLMEVDLT